VVPGAGRAGVVGLHGEELRVRVASPPVDGRANDELCRLLADVLGLRPREVEVLAGATSRSKQVLVRCPVERVVAGLAPWIAPISPTGG
jgi:uncharacterized protein (TIGR00251 family)